MGLSSTEKIDTEKESSENKGRYLNGITTSQRRLQINSYPQNLERSKAIYPES